MGVKGLWSLLEPVGRRVNIEALSGRRVAVDASIWLVQFIKAMRDEQGDMIHNAHVLGCGCFLHFPQDFLSCLD